MYQLGHQLLLLSLLAVAILASCAGPSRQVIGAAPTATPAARPGWINDFHLSSRKLEAAGVAQFFDLRPGSRSILASGGTKLTITVLDETRVLQGITTRVIEEREESGGAPAEISRNFFAIDPQAGDVFYFGEEVDIYSNSQVSGHGGAWLAGEHGNRPGLMMPGSPKVGMQYYQEVAPGVAEDRARVISISYSIDTPAGHFEHCVLTEESSALEIGVTEEKTYCPGVGLVQDESLLLVQYMPARVTTP